MKTYRSLTQEEIQQLRRTIFIIPVFPERSDWGSLKMSLRWQVVCVNIPDCIMRPCIM